MLLIVCLALAALLMSCHSCPQVSSKLESFTFVQICDTQLGFSDYQKDLASFRRAVARINELNPDFVVICGDLVNTADDRSFSDFKEIKESFKMPCYCVPGNHDIGNQPAAESLHYYRRMIGKDYYEVEHKGATFLFVNTQLWKENLPNESEQQDVWLKERLQKAAGKGRPVFMVGHYPLFCRQADEADEYMNLPMEKRRELLTLYEQFHVVAVLHGHTHKLTLNQYKNIQMVGAETTSRNFDENPLGFRLWQVDKKLPPRHEFVPLD